MINNASWTPLTLAIEMNFEAVKLLIANGANIDLCNGFGISPLSIAVYRNKLDVVKFLVQNGASININDGDGRTPFQNAVVEEHMEIITYLMENGADIQRRTNYFRHNSIELALKKNQINIMKKISF